MRPRAADGVMTSYDTRSTLSSGREKRARSPHASTRMQMPCLDLLSLLVSYYISVLIVCKCYDEVPILGEWKRNLDETQ